MSDIDGLSSTFKERHDNLSRVEKALILKSVLKKLSFANDVTTRHNDQDTGSRNSLSLIQQAIDSISSICNSNSAHENPHCSMVSGIT
ncbi:Uncharacterized protein HZ326_0533 [Fusarium oxysporum f. sp. albedinis]|nr:Uncharacterized protein HZ326_0533 [Fusarium oxysporum f. sp. albedinis]